MPDDAARATKTKGAYKGGDGKYFFDVDKLKGLDAALVMRRPLARWSKASLPKSAS